MNTSEDEPASGVNGRLRPRKSAAPSPQGKTKIKPETKTSVDKPKRTSTPSKAPPTKQDDLASKSDSSPATPQFLCPYCERTFASRQTASKHVRRAHPPASDQPALITCLFCNHTDADVNIIRHMVDSHPNQYFACLDCHARFSSTSELAEHKLNMCEKQKVTYRIKPHPKKIARGSKKAKKSINISRKTNFNKPSNSNKDFQEGHGFNGIVISCELKPPQDHEGADIEDNITTNLILPPSKNLGGNSVLEKNAVIVLDDIQWNKRIPPNFAFHNTDPDQILSRLGVVHRSPRTGESTRKDWFKALDDATQKFERCFDTKFYSKVASNVQENLAKFLDGSFNFNPDPDSTIKTRKTKNNVLINTAEGFPILLASEQYSRSVFDAYMPRAIAPKHKWKWDNLENDRSLMTAAEILKRDSHTNNCIITLVSSLDIWTQLSMRRKFDEKFNVLPVEKKAEKKNIISKELKEILESRDIPTSSQIVKKCIHKPAGRSGELGFPASLGLVPSSPTYELRPAVLSGEWVRPRCLVCCACGEQSTDSRGLSAHIATRHPNASVQCYEIVGDSLLNADILKHLYVPPSQVCNRTRPPRGFRECTKCNKSVTLEDLHQHMLECAGDTPAVRRRQPRQRPFGVRRRRPRLSDTPAMRNKIRKDIRSRRRQKAHIGPRPRIRTEVGDAETIRKMLADLPAKRHRVLVNPLNMTHRPRRKLDMQRSKLLMRKRSTEEKARKQMLKKPKPEDKEGAAMSDDPNKNGSSLEDDEDNKPLKPKSKPTLKTALRRREPMKRQAVVISTAKRKSLRAAKRRVENAEKITETPADSDGQDILIEKPEKIEIKKVAYKTRDHAGSRGSSNNRDEQRQPAAGDSGGGGGGGGSGADGSGGCGGCDNNHCAPSNAPLKHSIARLTANSETHDKSVQFHHSFLVQQECNNTDQHVPTGERTLFENEAVVSKLDKPPLNFCQKAFFDKNKNKPRKGLNDCIAMLKNKLVEPESCPSAGYVSVQCGGDDPIDDEPRVSAAPTSAANTGNVAASTERKKPRKSISKRPHPDQDFNHKSTPSPKGSPRGSPKQVNVNSKSHLGQETAKPLKHNIENLQVPDKSNELQHSQETVQKVKENAEHEKKLQKNICVAPYGHETTAKIKQNVESAQVHDEASLVPNYIAESLQNVKQGKESDWKSPEKPASQYRLEPPRNAKHCSENAHLQEKANFPQYRQESPRNFKHNADSYTLEIVNTLQPYKQNITQKIKQSSKSPQRQEKNDLVTHRFEAPQKPKQYPEHLQYPENLGISPQQEYLLHRHEAIRNLKQNPDFLRLQENLSLLPQYHPEISQQTLMLAPEPHHRQDKHAVNIDCDISKYNYQDANPNVRSRRNSGHNQVSPNVRSRRNSGHSQVSPQIRSNHDPGHSQVSPQMRSQHEFIHSQISPNIRSRRNSGHSQVSPQILSHYDPGHSLEGQNIRHRRDSGHSQVNPQVRSQHDSGHSHESQNIRSRRDSAHNQVNIRSYHDVGHSQVSPPVQQHEVGHNQVSPNARSRRNSAHSQDNLNIQVHNDYGHNQEIPQIQFNHDAGQNQVSPNIRARRDSSHSQVNLSVRSKQDSGYSQVSPNTRPRRDSGHSQVSRDSAQSQVSPQIQSRHDSGHSQTAETINEFSKRRSTEMYNEADITKKDTLEITTTWPSSLDAHPANSGTLLPFNKHSNTQSDAISSSNNPEGLLETDMHPSQNLNVYTDSRMRELPTNIPPAHTGPVIESILISAPLDLSSKVMNAFPTHLPKANSYYNYETLDLSNKKPDRSARLDLPVEEDIIDLRVKTSQTRDDEMSLDLCVKSSSINNAGLPTADIANDYPTDLSLKGKEAEETKQTNENTLEIQDLSASKSLLPNTSNLTALTCNHSTYSDDLPEIPDTTKKIKIVQDVKESTAELKGITDSENQATAAASDLTQKVSSRKHRLTAKTAMNIEKAITEIIITTTQTASSNNTHRLLDNPNDQMQKHIYDPTLKIPQFKINANNSVSEIDTSMLTGETAPDSTMIASSAAQDQHFSSLSPLTSSLSPLTSVVTIHPIPGRVLTTSNNKIESTTPVYTLANACIPVTKESSNAAVLTSTLLSIPGSTIASTTPVYTLTGTTMNAHAAFNNDLLNGSARNQPYLPSYARPNDAFVGSDMGISDHITKNMQKEGMTKELVADQDPETAKKIAMLPKELVDILGNMPIDHRNQLLNVLPQYVSTTVANYSSSTDGNQSIIPKTMVPPTGKLADDNLAFDPQSEDKKHSISYKVPSQTPLYDMSVNTSQYIDDEVHLAPVKSRKSSNEEEKPKLTDGNTNITNLCINQDRIIDLTEDDNVLPGIKTVDVPRIISVPQDLTSSEDTVISNKQKRNNNKTSSLRAVRIKAPSLRHKEIQNRESTEKNDVKKIHDVDKHQSQNCKSQPINESTLELSTKELPEAITKIANEEEKQPVTTNIEINNELAEIPKTTDNSLPTNESHDSEKSQVKHTSVETLKENLKEKIENDKTTKTIDCNKKVDNSKLNDDETIKTSRVDEEDSEDDIILAAIVKQRQKNITTQNMPNTKKKKKEKKSRKNLTSDIKLDEVETISDKTRPLDDSLNTDNLQKRDESSITLINDSKSITKDSEQVETTNYQLQSDVKLNITAAKSELTGKKVNTFDQGDNFADRGRHGKENNDNLPILRKDLPLDFEFPDKKSLVPEGSLPSVDIKRKGKSKKKKRGTEAKNQIIDQDISTIESQASPKVKSDDQTVNQISENSNPDNHCPKDCDQPDLDELKCEVKKNTKNDRSKKLLIECFNRDDSITEPQGHENSINSPLRRSRRGKSIIIEGDLPALETAAFDTTIDQKGPITKKQLIFSKLLDEEKQLSLASNSDADVTNNTSVIETTETPVSNVMDSKLKEIETSMLVSSEKCKSIKRKKSPQAKRKNKKKKSIDDKIVNDDTPAVKPVDILKNNADNTAILVSTIVDVGPPVETIKLDKPKEKTTKELDLKKSDGVLEDTEVAMNKSKNNSFPKSDITSLNQNKSVLEKRKISKVPSTVDFEITPKPKKTKFNVNKETDSNEVQKKDTITTSLTLVDSEQSAKAENLITTCYDVPIAARRTRSKSVVPKSSSFELYDPYNIDFDDMIQKPEPLRKPGTKSKEVKSKKKSNSKLTESRESEEKELKTEHKGLEIEIMQHDIKQNKPEISSPMHSKSANEAHVLKSNKTANDKELAHKKSLDHIKDELSAKDSNHFKQTPKTTKSTMKDTVSDSDESSKSDEPLKKYVEGKVKRMAAKSKALPKEINADLRQNEQDIEKPFTSGCKKIQRTATVSKNASNEMDEQMRSEQFMESFGFFSERKPRKSNLLATKKISETFHIMTNEGEDYYSSSRSSRKSIPSDTKKSNDGSHIQPSPLKKNSKRGRKKKDKEGETKIVNCFCKVCKKEYRRPDNFVRHQMTYVHIMKMAEVELKFKAYLHLSEEPNYLLAYKQHMDRLKILRDKAAKQRKNAKVKIRLPGLEEILADVHRTIRDQQYCHRELSRDEALFLDCCELLKESRRPILPVLPMAFLPPALPAQPAPVEAQLGSLPSTSSSLPSTSNSLPSTSAPLPSTSSQLPSTLSPLPSTSGYTPPTSSPLPSKSGYLPPSSSPLPSTSGNLPPTSSVPTSGYLQSAADYLPSTLSNLPSTSDYLPSISSSLPSTSNYLPSTSQSSLLPSSPSTSRLTPQSASSSTASSLRAPPICKITSDAAENIQFEPQTSETNFDYVPKAIDNHDVRSDDDVDSVTAKSILESEEVRFLENDLISNLKEAAIAKKANQLAIELNEASATSTVHPLDIASDIFLKPECHRQRQQMKPISEQDLGTPVVQENAPMAEQNAPVVEEIAPDVEESAPIPEETNKTKKVPEYKEKMYPDIIEDIDMFEDKFDKIKRKCRSQAAAAKQVQNVTEPSPGNKGRKKTEKKKGKKSSKKNNQNTVLTKGALKGFDGIKVSIPTSDINMSAIPPPPHEGSQKKKRKTKSKKKREKRDSETSKSHDSDHRKDSSHSQKKVDVYEFMDNEDAELFEFRPSTLMERFKSISKEAPSTSKRDGQGGEDDNSSESASDGDDFVYMSDDYVCSDDETENSLLSCELGNVKSDSKKATPLKRKDTVEKNAVMGKIFKHNAVRTEKKSAKSKETANPKANLDQLFDSLLEEEPPNTSQIDNNSDLSKSDETNSPKSQKSSSKNERSLRGEGECKPRKKSTSPDEGSASEPISSAKKLESEQELPTSRYETPKRYKYGPSTSKQGDDIYGPSTSSAYNAVPSIDREDTPPRKRESSPSKKCDTSPKNKSPELEEDNTEMEELHTKKSLLDKIHDMNEADYSADFDEDTGVARHRARRKCTVGKQNVLAETWSSESEPDGLPPRPTSAESVVAGAGRKKKGRKRDSQQAFGRRGKVTFNKKQDNESRVTSNKWSTPGSSGTGQGGGERSSAPCPPPAPSTPGAGAGAGAGGSAGSSSGAGTSAGTSGGDADADGTSKARPRPAAYYWSSEGDDEQEQQQPQHGWIVGNSHKRLVTMLAHAKGRKRNNDDKSHVVE